MDRYLFYIGGCSAALNYAAKHLENAGCRFSARPDWDITHCLLDVPSPADNIRIPETIPESACIIGGKLPSLGNHPVLDLLQDPVYVAENAYITAHCAVRLAMDQLSVPLRRCKVLVIGWGRIGKCLAALLKRMEADVTVAARKEADRAILAALGYQTADTANLSGEGYRIIFNTAPAMVLEQCPPCLKIDLASSPGINGQGVIVARGLPGKYAPEASGELIARRIIHHLKKEGTQ